MITKVTLAFTLMAVLVVVLIGELIHTHNQLDTAIDLLRRGSAEEIRNARDLAGLAAMYDEAIKACSPR